ncbi:MAG: hypothetical protein HC915_00470 [Anaerolineae bacterium]|nr:hypothetical protein [Anaerolineae bacterium]
MFFRVVLGVLGGWMLGLVLLLSLARPVTSLPSPYIAVLEQHPRSAGASHFSLHIITTTGQPMRTLGTLQTERLFSHELRWEPEGRAVTIRDRFSGLAWKAPLHGELGALGTEEALQPRPSQNYLTIYRYRDENTHRILPPAPPGQATGVQNAIITSGVLSPDGQHIAYSLASLKDPDNSELYLWKADGSGQPLRLTHHPERDHEPLWSPDGAWLMFTSYRHGHSDLFRIRPNGSDLAPITQDLSVEYLPSWSADGHWVLFSRPPGHLLRVPASGGQPELLYSSARGSFVEQVEWSPPFDLPWRWVPLMICGSLLAEPGDLGAPEPDLRSSLFAVFGKGGSIHANSTLGGSAAGVGYFAKPGLERSGP